MSGASALYHVDQVTNRLYNVTVHANGSVFTMSYYHDPHSPAEIGIKRQVANLVANCARYQRQIQDRYDSIVAYCRELEKKCEELTADNAKLHTQLSEKTALRLRTLNARDTTVGDISVRMFLDDADSIQ